MSYLYFTEAEATDNTEAAPKKKTKKKKKKSETGTDNEDAVDGDNGLQNINEAVDDDVFDNNENEEGKQSNHNSQHSTQNNYQ